MSSNIYKKIPCIPVIQPLGTFYLCSINSEILRQLTYPDTLTIDGVDTRTPGIYKLSGNQREEITEKRMQIGKYIDSIEASFPNTIILGANVDEKGDPIDDLELKWQIEKEGGINYLVVPLKKRNARIIDGQHRLRGFDYSSLEKNFDLPCSVYIDLPLAIQASIFATININQKKVDRSLAFELFGYNLDDEPSESWSPEKLAIFLTRKLNTDDESPLKGHIKVVARFDKGLFNQGDWLVATAVFVDGITSLISTNPTNDRDSLNMVRLEERKRALRLKPDRSPLRTYYLENNDLLIYKIVINYFKAVNTLLFSKPDKGYVVKSVGLQALFDILKMLCPKALEVKDISVEFFSSYLIKASHINFEDKFFQTSGIGRNRIKNVIALSSELIPIDKLKEKDREIYTKVIAHEKSDPNEDKWVWEDESTNEINRILSHAEWDFVTKTVSISSNVYDEFETFDNYDSFETKLNEIAEETAVNYMPLDGEVREQMQEEFDSNRIVTNCLENYKAQLIKLGWIN